MLKEQVQALLQENGILKRAVSIQHERQKEFESKSQELHQLKQLLSQCQEHIRTLEVRPTTFNFVEISPYLGLMVLNVNV